MSSEDEPDPNPETDPFLSMFGLYSEIWDGIDPDEYVRKLREDSD